MYRMLAVDSSVTVITWFPYAIFNMINHDRVFGEFDKADAQRVLLVYNVLGALIQTNCFTSPIIYFVCSESIRVSSKQITK